MGVDTVKLSYPAQLGSSGYQDLRNLRSGWNRDRHYGTVGPVWFTGFVHDDGTKVTVKGVGNEARILWEQSVPKFLGICGPSEPDDVRLVDRHLRRLLPGLGLPDIRRCDVTVDVYDPRRALLSGAMGWKPHARARYWQDVVTDKYEDCNTVFLHNKTRGVRVYDKYRECEQEWARDLSRVEYQVRGAWLEKLGLDRLNNDFARNADTAIAPLVNELCMRSGIDWRP